MKISIFYDHVKAICKKENIEISELSNTLKQYGVSGFDLAWSDIAANIDEVADELKKWGFEAASIYAIFNFSHGFDQGAIDALIRGAKCLSAKNILVVPGNISATESADTSRENMSEALRYACDVAEKENVSIMLEDFDDLRSPTVSTSGLEYFFSREKRLKFNLDTGNFCCVGDDIFRAIELFGDRIAHVHLKDRSLDVQNTIYTTLCADGKIYYPAVCGSGLMQIGKILKTLKNIGYDRYVSLEYFGDPESEKIFKSLEYIKNNV